MIKIIRKTLVLLLSLIICASMIPAVFATNSSLNNFKPVNNYNNKFNDAEGWYKNDIINAFILGIVKGNTDTTYNPGGDITVAETLTIAARIHSIYTTGKDELTNGNPWYQPYVSIMSKLGLHKRNN